MDKHYLVYCLPKQFTKTVFSVWIQGSEIKKYQVEQLQDQLMNIVSNTRVAWWTECMGRACTSLYKNYYLTHAPGQCLIQVMMLLLSLEQQRREPSTLILTMNPGLLTKFIICSLSLCNLQENKSVFHIMARCRSDITGNSMVNLPFNKSNIYLVVWVVFHYYYTRLAKSGVKKILNKTTKPTKFFKI